MAQLLKKYSIELPAEKYSKLPPTICMVPTELRRGDEDGCYDPVAVQIGLCRSKRLEELHLQLHSSSKMKQKREGSSTHHLREVLPKELQDMERYKSSCVLQLISRRRPDKKIPAEAELMMKRCYDSMQFRLDGIYQCHSDPKTGLEVAEALRAMLIDGCFILHRLLKYAHLAERVAEQKKQAVQQGSALNDGCCFILHRLLKKVAEKKHGGQLLDNDYGDHDWTQTHGRCFVWQLVTRDLLLLENQIPFFVLRDLFRELKKDGESDETLLKGGLMLFRALCPQMLPDSVSVPDIASKLDGVHHLLHLFYLLVGRKDAAAVHKSRALADVLPSELPQWIPGAKELLEAGIRLRKRKNAASFLDVTFDACCGVLAVPPLQLYDYSEALFRNMIAFEQTYPHTRCDISVYSVFMNCLVSTAEDARILHLGGILVNMMNGGDQDGGRHFFDRICSQVHFPSNNYLVDTMAGVSKYMQSRRHRWRAALVRDYFSNPWVAISVVAAVFLLCLTVLQTVFTVYPYFKPSK